MTRKTLWHVTASLFMVAAVGSFISLHIIFGFVLMVLAFTALAMSAQSKPVA